LYPLQLFMASYSGNVLPADRLRRHKEKMIVMIQKPILVNYRGAGLPRHKYSAGCAEHYPRHLYCNQLRTMCHER